MGGEDWDLEAVVRRFCSPEPGMMATTMSDPFSSLASSVLMEECLDENDEIFMSFPDLMANQKIFEELEELCKPFFIDSQHQQHQQQQSGKSLSSVSSVAEPSRRSKLPSSSSRSKRRKNQLKKVVREVPADGTAADDWAWRKYGQKPIKGSPFPRGYYRCSSCKGCPARKQVEKSQADPGILIVTYTAEHTHPVPTHRNSLAGTTRQKLPPPPPPTAAGDIVALSPTTPSKAATSMASDEEEEEEASMVEDALFVGLEDL